MIRPPPLLLGATLLFWGWQSGFFVVGGAMAILVEAAHVFKGRWELANEDFQRIWTFCTLLLLTALVYSFTANEGPADFRNFLQNPNYATQRGAGAVSSRTAASVIRWLPMLFFPFLIAQVYSSREAIPLETISLILRRRWRKARQLGQIVPDTYPINVGFPFFILCLFAACVHPGEDNTFFYGLCVLVPWALWPLRPRRYNVAVWGAAMLVVLGAGYFGQRGISYLTRYIENFNTQLFARLSRGRFDASQTRTEIGQIGRVKTSPRIMIRLETSPNTPPPDLLREASYRTYKGPFWFSESARYGWEGVLSETNQTTWPLVAGRSNQASVNIACYLPGSGLGATHTGLLPLPTGSGRLENLNAYLMVKNPFGAVQVQGPGLLIFDAWYGPGPTIDSAPATDDLLVPGREWDALDEIIRELDLTGKPRDEVIRSLKAFFLDKFSYSTWQDPPRKPQTNETALGRFLLRTRQGHCEFFATASVLLLRRLEIPARYAVGYAVHESSGERKYVARQRDAHAWCLVWNEAAKLWENLDTTPGSWIEMESRNSRFQFLSDFWSRLTFELSKLRWGQTRLRQYILWGLAPVLGLLLYQIIFRRKGRKRSGKNKGAVAETWPGLDSEFYPLIRKVEQRGLPRFTGEPLSAWLQRAEKEPSLAGLRPQLRDLLRLHYRYRFDPAGLNHEEREELRRQASQCVLDLDKAARV